MPVYVFRKPDNEFVELVMSGDELEQRQYNKPDTKGQFIKLDDGTEAQRIYTPVGGMLPAGWPLVSVAAGVGIDQIQEASEIDRKAGVPTQYTRDGDVIFNDPGHRRKWLKAHSMFDRSSYI